MSTRKVFSAIALVTVFVSATTFGAEPECFPICTWADAQICPAVSGNFVVWMDKRSGNYDIYRNNPTDVFDTNGVLVLQAPRDQKVPAISGSVVVWEDHRVSDTNTDIYRRPLLSGPEVQVCTDEGKQQYPAISGDIIVWHYAGDIYGYRISDETTFTICTDPAVQSYPAVSGSVVVWQDNRNGGMDIYGKNLDSGTEFEICVSASWKQNAAIDGDIVVWQDDRNVNHDIYGKNLSTGEDLEICNHGGDQINPAVSGDIVVWEDHRNGDNNIDIYGCRISAPTVFPVCTRSSNQANPAISGNLAVWEDYSKGLSNPDIYGAYIAEPVEPSTIALTSPNGGEEFLAGSDCTITWQTGGPSIGHVKLEYSIDGRHSYTEIDSESIIDANDGSHLWQPLPIADSNHCFVRITGRNDPAISDFSDSEFTIFRCNAALTADLSGDCKVDFADFALLSGQWLSCGNPSDPDWCP
jgi:TolB protein